MPKQVYQASDGTVFNDFEEANKYEVQQEMDTFERLGLDGFLEQEHEKSEEAANPGHYHGCRQFLSDLLLWCTQNDKVLTIQDKDAPVYREAPAPPPADATSGAERGFPDISMPPGMKVDPTKPVPYEPPPADGIAGRN